MSKKKVTINISEISVHVCNHEGGENRKDSQLHPLQEMLNHVTNLETALRTRTISKLKYIDRATTAVKNDQDFRTIVYSILNAVPDVTLETPEAGNFMRELVESGFFKKNKEEKAEPAQQSSL